MRGFRPPISACTGSSVSSISASESRLLVTVMKGAAMAPFGESCRRRGHALIGAFDPKLPFTGVLS